MDKPILTVNELAALNKARNSIMHAEMGTLIPAGVLFEHLVAVEAIANRLIKRIHDAEKEKK